MAGARAHNRWLAELCATSPDRRAGVALVPILDDIDAAVVEIARAHDSGLRGGILIPSMWEPYAPYHDERYDPIWAVCQELDLPVHVHSGAADKASYGAYVGIYITEVRWWSARPLWFLIWSGVFEQFPRLKFVVTECGAFWAADLLWTMDTVFDREHGVAKLGAQLTAHLSMRPSEYFDRNCFIGASNTRRRELARRYEIGVGNIMWGNDFPHPEGTWPHTRECLRNAFCDIPIDETRRMLGLNAAELYHFDVDALAPLADRTAPSPTDFGQTGDEAGEVGGPGRRRPPVADGGRRAPGGGRLSDVELRPRRQLRPVRGRLRRLAVRPVRPPARARSRSLVRPPARMGAHPLRRRALGAARSHRSASRSSTRRRPRWSTASAAECRRWGRSPTPWCCATTLTTPGCAS